MSDGISDGIIYSDGIVDWVGLVVGLDDGFDEFTGVVGLEYLGVPGPHATIAEAARVRVSKTRFMGSSDGLRWNIQTLGRAAKRPPQAFRRWIRTGLTVTRAATGLA